MGIIGIPFASLFDRTGYYDQFLSGISDRRFLSMGFFAVLYATMVMAFIYYVFGLKKQMITYASRAIAPLNQKQARRLWMATFVLALICLIYLLIRSGGQHPAISALGSGYQDIKVLRGTLKESINMNVFNIGLKFFLPFNLIISLFFIGRRMRYLIPSLILGAIMGTYVLEKSPIISILVLITMFKMLMTGIRYRKLMIYAVMALTLLSGMYFLTRFATNLSELVSGVSKRIFYGEISDLPRYFELFEKNKVSPVSLLPPFVTEWIGFKGVKSASRIVMEAANPEAVRLGTAGVANSFYVGEAFAVGGIVGVALSPFLVMMNIVLFILIFSKLPKSVFSLFLFSWFINKVFDGVFGGISYFTFSGLHLVLFAAIYLALCRAFAAQANRLKASGPKKAF